METEPKYSAIASIRTLVPHAWIGAILAVLLPLSILLLSRAVCHAQLAATSPMGWNSWDSYGLTITERQFKENVQWLHTHLQPYGWQYVVIDEGWYLAHPSDKVQGYALDANGRYLPATNRFPSAADGRGFRPLAAYVHSLGLKFGIHIVRGIPRAAVQRDLPIAGSKHRAMNAADTSDTCAWNSDNYGLKDNAAGRAYFNSVGKLYASWGVDFIKVDCISKPYKKVQIHMFSEAITASNRPMVLSLSPGSTPLADADDASRHAQMWRISDDLWDIWGREKSSGTFPQSAVQQFPLVAAWERYAGPGHWPDADMLPFGWLGPHPGWGDARNSRLTVDETRTVLTLWSIARSPLMLGANLTRMDRATEDMLINRELLAVDQHSSGNRAILHSAQCWVWTARSTSAPEQYVAFFNVSDQPLRIRYGWRQLDIKPGKHAVRDIWTHKNLGRQNWINTTLPPHGSSIYLVR